MSRDPMPSLQMKLPLPAPVGSRLPDAQITFSAAVFADRDPYIMAAYAAILPEHEGPTITREYDEGGIVADFDARTHELVGVEVLRCSPRKEDFPETLQFFRSASKTHTDEVMIALASAVLLRWPLMEQWLRMEAAEIRDIVRTGRMMRATARVQPVPPSSVRSDWEILSVPARYEPSDEFELGIGRVA